MATPSKYQSFQGQPVPTKVATGVTDVEHILDMHGNIIGWIDANGVPQGTLSANPSGITQASGNTTMAATATLGLATAPSGDVITTDGNGNAQDSGVLLSSLTPNANAFVKSVNGNGIQYVSPQGNDSNDGLSWGTSKLTIRGALINLPGGSASPDTCGKGIVYVANNSAAHPNSSCGIWLMGSTDPNYSSPPTGWLKCTGLVQIIGVGGTASSQGFNEPRCFITGGGSSDINHPGIWISGLNEPMTFQNLLFQNRGRAIVVGETSNNGRAGSGTGGSSGITFRNCWGTVAGTQGLGPVWDIVGGSFWMRFLGCGGSGIDFLQTSNTNNNAAVFLFDGTGNNGVGYMYMDYCSLVSGCIKINPGDTNPAGQTLSINHIESESQTGPAGVYITGSVYPNDVIINGVHLSDSGNIPAVLNLGASKILVSDLVSPAVPAIVGPATVLYNSGTVIDFLQGGTPYVQGQTGFVGGGYIYGNTDVSRRQFGPVAVVRTNAAKGDGSQGASVGTWTGNNTAPDGTSTALRGSNSSSQASIPVKSVFSQTLSVGDIIVAGVWTRLQSGTFATPPAGWPGSIQVTGATVTWDQTGAGFGNSTTLTTGPRTGEWFWSSVILKVKTVTNNPANLGFSVIAPANGSADFYAPVFYYIPTGTATDAELMTWYTHLQPHLASGTVGTLSTMLGQVAVIAGTGIGNGSSGNITAPALGTGAGPATPGTIVAWAKLVVGSTTYWMPLAQ